MRRLLCRLFGHRWSKWRTTECWLRVQDCERCDAYRYDTETGAPSPVVRFR